MMLTELLFFPSASHQYSPLSVEKAVAMVQDPVISTLMLHIVSVPLIFLITLHLLKYLKMPLQFIETDSYSKSCSLGGVTVGKVASDKEKNKTEMKCVSREVFFFENDVFIVNKTVFFMIRD